MRTASFDSYQGPGRIALSRPPTGTPRGYRLITPRALYMGDTKPSRETVWSLLALADACSVWRSLHALVSPYEPVLVGLSPSGVESYRTILAAWIEAHTGETVSEITDADHKALKVRPTLHGLRPAIWPAAEPATETA